MIYPIIVKTCCHQSKLDGHHAAVVACCMVLGRDSEAVLGRLDTDNIQDIVAREAYSNLHQMQTKGRFDEIP